MNDKRAQKILEVMKADEAKYKASLFNRVLDDMYNYTNDRVYVSEYTRTDGTIVTAHTRSYPSTTSARSIN